MAREAQGDRFGSADGGASAPVDRVRKGVFRREGEYWNVGFAENAFRLKDSKGLGYLAHLIRHPQVEFHVLDLAGGIASRRDEDDANEEAHGLPRGAEALEKSGLRVSTLGDAGEMLDEKAKVTYRRRIAELREELEEAKELGKVERGEQIEEEIDAITRELSRAVGLGGRNRKAASASERARQSITKTIKAVLDRIAEADDGLGGVLSRGIRTGTFCSYQPDPDSPIAWEFAATRDESAPKQTSISEPAPVPAAHLQTTPTVLEITPFSLAERTAFVGREAEYGVIRTAIDRALTGRGSLIMIGGGPGVGKTRLAMEMAEYATRVGFNCGIGHCYERDEPYPYLPFVEIIESHMSQAASLDDFRRRLGENAPELAQIAPSLRRVFPDIPQPLEVPPAQKRRYLFQSVSEALARATQTRSYVYILDDLQWADESSLGLLIHLANRVAQLPVVLIGTYRDAYSEHNSALVRTLEELIRMGNRPLKLGGLSRDAVAQMLHSLSRTQAPESLVNLISEESQGYPFFIEEVYRHLVEEGKVFDAAGRFRTDIRIDEIDVPENVRLIIGRRLERFDGNEKRALAAAAMIGRSFSFRLLIEVSQIDVDELFTVIEKAQHMGIILASSEGPDKPFTFAHELVRQTLLAAVSTLRRQQLHATVAAAIELIYPRFVNERAGEISDHLLKAGSFADGRKVVPYLRLAGKNALEAAAFEEAQRSFRAALSYQGAVDPREKAELLVSLAMAERGLEQWNGAIADLKESLELYISLGDREMIAKNSIDLTDTSLWAGHFQEAAETARRALAEISSDRSIDRARLLAALGQAGAACGDYQSAHDALSEALNIASQISDPKLRAGLLGARSIVNFHFFRLKETAEDGFLSEKSAGAEASPWQRALQLRILHQALLYLGRLDEAAGIGLNLLEPLARKIGQIVLFRNARAWGDFGKNPDLAKLQADLRPAAEFGRTERFRYWQALVEVQSSTAAFFAGDWPRALTHAQAACRPEPGSSIEGLGLGTVFRQLSYAGDREGAFAILNERRAWLPVIGKPNTRGSWLMLALVVEGLVMLGEKSQAGKLYPPVAELLDSGAVALWPIFRLSQTIAGIAAAAARRWQVAEEHFRRAMQQAEAFPQRLEQAEIRRFHAMMLMDRASPGDRAKARTLLGEAIDTYAQIGMPRHIEMSKAVLT